MIRSLFFIDLFLYIAGMAILFTFNNDSVLLIQHYSVEKIFSGQIFLCLVFLTPIEIWKPHMKTFANLSWFKH